MATVVREGETTPPTPGMLLRPGDELLLVSHDVGEREIHAVFQ